MKCPSDAGSGCAVWCWSHPIPCGLLASPSRRGPTRGERWTLSASETRSGSSTSGSKRKRRTRASIIFADVIGFTGIWPLQVGLFLCVFWVNHLDISNQGIKETVSETSKNLLLSLCSRAGSNSSLFQVVGMTRFVASEETYWSKP